MHSTQRIGSSAELLVAYRFIQAGRRVSWPMVVCGYDLIVDSGEGLFRVQVKQAAKEEKGWHVRLQKTNPSLGVLYAGRYDYLCAVVDPNTVYVIPEQTLRCAHDPERVVASVYVSTSERFGGFLNKFEIGTGEFAERVVSERTELSAPKRTLWYAKGNPRKRHRHLTTQEVLTLRSIPIRLTRNDPSDGIPVEQIAKQYGVHVQTIRNLMKGRRKDLTPTVDKSSVSATNVQVDPGERPSLRAARGASKGRTADVDRPRGPMDEGRSRGDGAEASEEGTQQPTGAGTVTDLDLTLDYDIHIP